MTSRATAIAALMLATSLTPSDASTSASGQRYLVVQQLASDVKVPVVGAIRSTTHVVGWVDVQSGTDRVRGKGVVCDIDVKAPIVKPHFSAAFRRAISPLQIDARVSEDGQRWDQPAIWRVHGARVDDPQRSPLPQSADDPRVTDPDNDGNPGLTVAVKGLVRGKMFVAQRGSMSWSARRRADGSFSGPVKYTQEQALLGATSRMLRKKVPPQPRAEDSKIWLFPVGPSEGCVAARDRVTKLTLD